MKIVTKDHLKLLRRLNLQWQYCEYGAPGVDPKRPYRNSDVENDIREMLKKPDMTDGECELIHRETLPILRMILRRLDDGIINTEFHDGI